MRALRNVRSARLAARLLVLGLLLSGGAFSGASALASPPSAAGDVVRAWDDLSLRSVKAKNATDAPAARLYAMVHVAMYDAVNGLRRGPDRRDAALVAAPHSAAGDPTAAAATAAHDVLAATYPDLAASLYDPQLASDLADVHSPGQAKHGQAWGGDVAAQVLAARAADGSSPDQIQLGGTDPGIFTANWSGVQFRNLKPFAIADPAAYVGHGPPPLASPEYAQAFNQVKALGNAALPDADKLATFRFWSLAANTIQPPGAWLRVAQTVSASQSLSLADTARLFALESMAMADTVAPTYTTKVVFHAWRPTTAIRRANEDGNPDTDQDPTWSARAGSVGGTPENWSGHSSFSSAAAAVLGGFFCNDAISFSLVTDIPSTETRTYPGFSAAATQAGLSRVVGGLHFEFSNQDGATAGRSVAAEVLQNALLLQRGPTHHGTCPL